MKVLGFGLYVGLISMPKEIQEYDFSKTSKQLNKWYYLMQSDTAQACSIITTQSEQYVAISLTGFKGGEDMKAGTEVGCTFLNKDISGITPDIYRTVQAFH